MTPRRPAIFIALVSALCLPLIVALALAGDSVMVCISLQDLSLTFLPGHAADNSSTPTGNGCCQHHHEDRQSGRQAPSHPDEHDGHAHFTICAGCDGLHLMPAAAQTTLPLPAAAGVFAIPQHATAGSTHNSFFRCARPPLLARPGALTDHADILRL